MAPMKITVIGAGAWGTTLASSVAPRAETWLWAREDEVVESIADHDMNDAFLPGARLSPELRATAALAEALEGADVVIVAVPAQHVRATMGAALAHAARSCPGDRRQGACQSFTAGR